MKITRAQYQAAYQVATEVYSGQSTILAGAELLESQHGLNKNSAKAYINDFKHMMKGAVFQRALSAPSIDYFLSQVKKDFGLDALALAIASVRKHITYYEDLKGTNLSKLRAVVQVHDSTLGFKRDLEQHLKSFEAQVTKSLGLSSEVRKKRINLAARLPRQVVVTTTAFARNPDVVAEVLERASGVCERCAKAAPFKRKSDGTLYLEVHHVTRLADGGEDTVENAQALCPNCHRDLHYGA